jgi:NADH-quinone oxidoreductase subunit E
MSMFPFAENMISPQAKENPFLALMPGMEPLQKTTESFMKGMGVSNMPKLPPMPFSPMMADADAIEANIETMMKAVPGFEGMPNLATHPMAAMAAGAAVSMGATSQMMGTMFGAMTGMMDNAVRMQKATRDISPFAPPALDGVNPLKFEWAFGTGEATAEAKAPAAKTAATPAPKRKAETAVKTAVAAKAKPAAKAAPKSGVKADATAAPKPVKAPKVKAAAPAPAAAPKASAKKANGTAEAKAAETSVVRLVPSAEPVASVPARPGGPASAADIMPEDFKQPSKAEKPAKPDDLKMIAGVGPKLESVLNGLGIWTFGQIAEWTANEVAWVDDYLQFKGRIERDDWIAQAAALAKGGRDEYVKKFGKEPR